MIRFFETLSLASLVLLIGTANVDAQFDHPDVNGTNIDYTDIFETTNTGSPLFGAPSVDGDDLDFPVSGFSANATDGAIDFLNGMVELDASTNSGQTFNSVVLDEFGVYFNSGPNSMSSVTTFLFVTVDGETFQDQFSQEFGEGSGAWNASFKIDIPDTESATIMIHNILFANSGKQEVASISKRDVRLRLESNVIPEPASAAILALGLIGLVSRRRRA